MPAKKTPEEATTLDDARWASVVARDAAADGSFFFAVRTTLVYCRPSCGARAPLRANVRFYATTDAAERAGYRACKRCKPNAPARAVTQTALVAKLCRFIENAEHPPSLEALARHADLSAHHVHRVFKAVTGLTPRAYAAAHRARRVRRELESAGSVTAAIYGAGFNSNGRFYESANAVLGMTPTRFRNGGIDTEIRFAVGQCSLGAILVAASERGVCAILIGDAPEPLVRDLEDRFPRATLVGGDASFEALVAKVVGLVEAPRLGIDLPLDLRGTAFQERVWRALREIPPGKTESYTELAERIGVPKSVRAVASACASNPVAVAIPCHRVVRADGALAGYRWGIERKRTLLARERKTP